jgi:hypothetical protein
MKKLILASVFFAVFLLEVAFGVYVAYERRYEYQLSRDTKFADIKNSVASVEIETLPIAEPDFSQPNIVEPQPSKKEVNRLSIDLTAKAPASLSKPKVANYKPAVAVSTGARKQIENVSEQKTPPTEIIETNYAAKEIKPTKTNKSFMAILKKPLGWIKSVGSKLK